MIGKLEDFLVVSLVLVGAYAALAIIFTAKTIVRAQHEAPKSSYFVLGTLANFSWALGLAIAARLLISLFGYGPLISS